MTVRTRFGARGRHTALVPPQKTTRTGTAVLRLDGPIDSWGGDWGTSAAEFNRALAGLGDDVEQIELRVNSPGGDVFDGIAILNALRSHPARVVAVVEGLAASAASFIVAGCDEVVMARNSELFVHDAQGAAVGGPATMQTMADDLARISDNLASIYAEKAGDGDVARWRALMSADTWFTAEGAVEAGLADRVDDARPADEAAKQTALAALAAFTRSRPTAAAPDLPSASAAGSTSPEPTGDTTQKEDAMGFTPEQLDHLRAAVGVSRDADEATIIAAVDEALTERAGDEQPVQNAAPDGMVVMDAETLAQLRADAELGRRAHEAQAQAQREATVQAAIADGRIAPARRDHWLAQLAADPGAADVLASLERGLIPVAELGHAAEGVISQRDADYEALFGAGKDA